MAVIVVGTEATIQSPTAEGQFMQLIEYFQGLENIGGNITSYFSGNYDSDALIFNGDFIVPVLFDGTNMAFVGKTDGFLTGSFSPGTGGLFTATTALNYFIQVISHIIRWQNDLAKNPQKLENLTCTLDLNKRTLTGRFSLPFTRANSDTGIVITPKEYLFT
ncbi:hypothetical protein [Microcoleus sp. N9_A1]|uniref:hypothetical protein n=1 Tax=Microcoleus sp. N9_A1 TaxID=3055380 RepID=UPI002FD35A50